MAYTEKRNVSVVKTKAKIEEIVQKAGVREFVSGYKGNIAFIEFSMGGRQICFTLPLPDRDDKEFWYTKERRYKRTEQQAYAAWEQACRGVGGRYT